MSLSTTDNRFVYDGDATTTVFSFPRKIIEATHLDVYLYDEDDDSYALQTLNTHYTFAGSGLTNGIYASATITFTTAPGTDKKVVLYRDPSLIQEADFTGETNVLNALNRFADRVTMWLQRVQDQLDRTIKLPDGDYATSWGNTNAKADYASALLGFNSSGVPIPSNGTSTVAVSTAMTPVVQAADIGAAGALLGVPYIDPTKTPYSADNSGTTDASGALQAAIDAAQSSKRPLYLHGDFKINTTLLITNHLTIIGSGKESARLMLGSATMNAVEINTARSVTLSSFGFGSLTSGGQTAGDCVVVGTTSPTVNSLSRFHDLGFFNVWGAIDFKRAAYFHVHRCIVIEYGDSHAIRVRNLENADEGDSTIDFNIFYKDAAETTGAAILYESSGGLKVVSNKMLSGAYGLHLDYEALDALDGTGNLIISGNSMENQHSAGVMLEQQGGTAVFDRIQIHDNQISVLDGATGILSDAGGRAWIKMLSIRGNVLGVAAGATLANCIYVRGATGLFVDDNSFEGFDGDIYTIIVGEYCDTVRIGRNFGYNIDHGTAINDGVNVLREQDPFVCQGRLTLETATPVSTSDQTAKTTVYFTPYYGNQIALYDSIEYWNIVNFTEKSIKLTDTQNGATTNSSAVITGLTDTSQLCVGMEASGAGIGGGAVIASIDSATQVTLSAVSSASATVAITFKIPASTPVDIFGYESDNVLKLSMVMWTNATTRATALTTQDGVYVRTGYVSQRYLGTVATTATAGQTELSFGGAAAGGTAGNILVWNAYNRVDMGATVRDTTDSWTLASDAIQAANNSTGMRVNFVQGLAEDLVEADYGCVGVTDSGVGSLSAGVGFDSVSAFTGRASGAFGSTINVALEGRGHAKVVGLHYVSALEAAGNAGTATFRGDIGLPGYIQGALNVKLRA